MRSILAIIFFLEIFLTPHWRIAFAKDNLVEKLQHVLQPGDQFETDIERWTVEDDFFCLFSNGTFGMLDDYYLCDGNVTCASGADESELLCHSLEKCPPGKVKCPKEKLCLATSQLCDGMSDCTEDAWDEREAAGCLTGLQANSSLLQCPDGMFACLANVKCLTADALCNFKRDCDDGSDESLSTCPTGQVCPDGFFHCYKTGPEDDEFFHHCITNAEVCNQIADCPNLEDEMPDESPCTLESLLQLFPPHERRHHRHHHMSKHIVSNGTIPGFIFHHPFVGNDTGTNETMNSTYYIEGHIHDAIIHLNGTEGHQGNESSITHAFNRTSELVTSVPMETRFISSGLRTSIGVTTPRIETKIPMNTPAKKQSDTRIEQKSQSAKTGYSNLLLTVTLLFAQL